MREILNDVGRIDRRHAVSFRIGVLHASSPTIVLEPVAETDDEMVIDHIMQSASGGLARLEETGTPPDWMTASISGAPASRRFQARGWAGRWARLRCGRAQRA